jgi:hypothetical protein
MEVSGMRNLVFRLLMHLKAEECYKGKIPRCGGLARNDKAPLHQASIIPLCQ